MAAMNDVRSPPTRSPSATARLLIPVKRPGDARPAVAYALSRSIGGERVEVALLHVEGVPSAWHHEHAESRVPARQNAKGLFERAARMLESGEVEFAVYVRSGPVAFSILDAAEQLDCSEIVVPAPAWPLARFWSRQIVDALVAGPRSIPLVLVNRRGRKLAAIAVPRATSTGRRA